MFQTCDQASTCHLSWCVWPDRLLTRVQEVPSGLAGHPGHYLKKVTQVLLLTPLQVCQVEVLIRNTAVVRGCSLRLPANQKLIRSFALGRYRDEVVRRRCAKESARGGRCLLLCRNTDQDTAHFAGLRSETIVQDERHSRRIPGARLTLQLYIR